MKSEKARQELDDGSWKVEVGFEDEEFDLPYYAVRVDVAQYAVEIAEQEAEERMRKELTRWNDPKVILPAPGIQVIIKLKYKNGMICYAAARFSRKEGLWFYNQYSVCEVESIIGWREIHE